MRERSVVVKFRAEVAQFRANTQAASDTLSKFSTKHHEAARKSTAEWDKIGRGAGIAGLAIGAGIGLAISKFADFDQAMSAAAAGTNATANELGALREAAIKAGADTMFSATEAANAITEMGKAGVSTKDILGGGLIGAMNLAAAGQLDVGQAAEIAATALTQFNLSGVQLSHVADLYSAAAGKAQGGVSDIAEAMKYAGVTASSMGISIEETTGTLALFASKGIIGEQAGTSFRGMLLSLTSPSKIAKTAMDTLGISMYDASGKFVGIQGAADELQKKLGPLDEATRNQALGQIFGNESMNAAVALYQGGAKAVQDWTGKVNDAGFAQEQARKLTDNWKGDLERLRGSLDTVFIQSGSSANGALRSITQGLEHVTDSFGAMPQTVQTASLALGAATAAAAILGGGLLYLVPKAAAAKAAIVELGLASQATADKGFTNAGKAAKGFGLALTALTIAGNVGGGKDVLKDWGDQKLGVDLLSNADAVKVLNERLAEGAKASNIDLGVKNFGDLLQSSLDPSAIEQIDSALGGLWAAFGGEDLSNVKVASKRLGEIDSELTNLVSSGHGKDAERVFSQLANEAVRSGVPLAKFKEMLPGYTEALAATTVQTDKTGESTSKMADAAEAARGATDATSSAILLLGANASQSKDQVDELAKTIQADMDAASKAFTSSTDVLGKYDPSQQIDAVHKAKADLDKAEKDAQNTRQKQAAKGNMTVAQQQQLARAQQAVEESTGKKRIKAAQNLADLQARLKAKGSATVSDTQSLDSASQRVTDARKALADAQKAASDATLENSYKSTLKKAQAFTRDINEVTKRGLDPNTVAKLLQEGPEQAAPALEALLGSNSKNLIKMSNDAEAELRKINGSVVEQSRLTSLALNSSTDQMGQDLDAAMAISAAKAASGGKATGAEIAKGIGLSLPEVQRIAGEFGIALNSVPPPPPIPLTVDTSTGKANVADLKQELANLDGTTYKTYIDTIVGTRTANERDRRQEAANSKGLTGTIIDTSQNGKPKWPPNALGTDFFRGGMTLVGEQGPEVVSLPRGSAVYSAPKSREIAAALAGGVRVQGSAPVSSSHKVTNNSPTYVDKVIAADVADFQRQGAEQRRRDALRRQDA